MHCGHPLAPIVEPDGLLQQAAGQIAREAVEWSVDQEVLWIEPSCLELWRRQPAPEAAGVAGLVPGQGSRRER